MLPDAQSAGQLGDPRAEPLVGGEGARDGIGTKGRSRPWHDTAEGGGALPPPEQRRSRARRRRPKAVLLHRVLVLLPGPPKREDATVLEDLMDRLRDQRRDRADRGC